MKAGTYKVIITVFDSQHWYDSNGNLIHFRNSDDFESWWEYDSNGNKIHSRNSNNLEIWYDYDSKGNKIHYRNSDDYEEWYDSKGNQITQEEFNQIHKPCEGKTVTIDGKEYVLTLKD